MVLEGRLRCVQGRMSVPVPILIRPELEHGTAEDVPGEEGGGQGGDEGKGTRPGENSRRETRGRRKRICERDGAVGNGARTVF